MFDIMGFFANKRLSWASEFQYALVGWVGWVNGVVDILDLMHWTDTLQFIVTDGGLLGIVIAYFHLGNIFLLLSWNVI